MNYVLKKSLAPAVDSRILTLDFSDKDLHYMRRALAQAELAYDAEEVPIGAVLVMEDKIIARGYNQTELLKDCTAHAEMIALTAAFASLGSKYLPGATLYVTVEPCLMCAGALHWSKLGRVVWGAADPKNGHRKYTDTRSPFHPKTEIETGVLGEEAAALMQAFFRQRRG